MKLTAQIELGDGAIATIVNPQSFYDGGVMWRLRYGSAEEVRYMAASIIESYDYLISSDIGITEAIRRLRILRSGRAALAQGGGE
ncbi:hypothetical protein [Paenochrobactrum pullorum]|uniref:hypothetical protein n=1 Tax=Paenochrobactrum pullorum TaxID=1324351 RepID=UPI0035BC1288